MKGGITIMRRITTKFSVAALTLVGITAAAVWFGAPHKQFADDIYFPMGVFSAQEGELLWIRKFYSSSLAAMEEPPLKDKRNIEEYRFLWLRSFHPPVSVRLWQTGTQSYMSTKQLSNVGVPKNGEAVFIKTLAVNETRSMTKEEWAHFQELLKKAEFWSMPTTDETPIGLDGAGWLLEGVKQDQYHVVHRQSPEDGTYREVCIYLMRVSGVKIDESKGELY
jgi:hypothetical protein